MGEILLNDSILAKRKNIEGLMTVLNALSINLALIGVAIYIKDYPFQKWVFLFALLSIIQLIINIVTVRKLEGKFFSLTTLFLLFSFITHLGLVIIFGFNINVELPWDPMSTISTKMFKDASFFSLCCHLFLILGMSVIFINTKTIKIVPKLLENENNQLALTRNIGTILLFAGLLPMLYIDINKIILYANGNYLDTFQLGIPSFLYIIASFSDIGIIMLLIGNKSNNSKVLLLLILVTIYKGALMFTGSRGEPILYLLTLYFIYYNFIKIKKIKSFKIPLYLFLIYMVGFLTTFISRTRMMSINDVNTFIDVLKSTFVDFSPFSVIAEFGITIITLGISIEFFSFNNDFQYGLNYLLSLLNIFPNVGGVLDFTIPKTIYIYNYPAHLRSFLGGSYLGEAFYSFGYYGMIFIAFIGMLISYISLKFQELFLKQKYIQLSILLILFPNLLWWTRAYFADMVREFTWISICTVILTLFLKRNK
ncbi:O-antigen polysaccharide polymerase Wzy [Solibacillus sp. FSL H8-0523]|uniref:O-antigen polysaccharide polymerase Wzy n=1 Tax=Solibacillus sp. FSL H8-0523 TaxID=2954511 RepID=UPI00310134B3